MKSSADNQSTEKRNCVRQLAKKIDDVIEKWEIENNIDEEYYKNLSTEHFRIKADGTESKNKSTNF